MQSPCLEPQWVNMVGREGGRCANSAGVEESPDHAVALQRMIHPENEGCDRKGVPVVQVWKGAQMRLLGASLVTKARGTHQGPCSPSWSSLQVVVWLPTWFLVCTAAQE